MFNKIRNIAFAGIIAIPFAACSPQQVTSITTTLLTDVDSAVISACKAFPTVDSILALLNQGVAATAGALSAAFCAAFQSVGTTPSPAPGPAPAALKAINSEPQYFCTPDGTICGWK
jgi:hypothetical protein